MASNTTSQQPSGFLERFCNPQTFADQFQGIALVGYSPCFEEIAILGPVHIACILLLVWRIWYLFGSKRPTTSARLDKGIFALKILSSIICFVVPVGELQIRLFISNIAPFELLSATLICVAWLLMTISLALEALKYRPAHQWVYRFLWILTFVAGSVRFREIVLLAGLTGRSYFTTAYVINYVGLTVLFVLALFHWPPAFADRVDEETPLLPLERRIEYGEDVGDGIGVPCPEEKASWPSRLFFLWFGDITKVGAKRQLQAEDIWNINARDNAENLLRRFEPAWEKEKKKKKPSLFRTLVRVFGWQFFKAGIWKILNDASQFIGPLVLNRLIAFVGDPTAPVWIGYAWAVAVFVGQYIGATGENQYFLGVMRTGMNVRTCLAATVYKKSLRLSSGARQTISTGGVVNHMSVDSDKVQMCTQNFQNLWSAPIRVIVSLVLLYNILGWASLVGTVAFLLCVPLQTRIVQKLGKYARKNMQISDTRVKLVSELMTGIRIIKFYVWERPYLDKIRVVREEQLVWALWTNYMRSATTFVMSASPLILAVVSFTVFALAVGEMNASVAFTSVSLFTVLRMPLFTFPNVVQAVTEASVSLKRIQKYLLLEEKADENRAVGEPAIVVNKGSFSWWGEGSQAIADIDLTVPNASLTAIVGKTGCGKSSLVSAILGEMETTNGNATVSGTVAYVPQKAWIFNGTVRQNILFGMPFNEEKYHQTLEVCQLRSDMATWPSGDMQEIGEQGVNLSGGQKQRVSLARAVYARADVYIFDDPLSALDAHVGKAVFEDCICGYLKDKVRLLVCNQLYLLAEERVDSVVVMREGRILEQGPIPTLLGRKGVFTEMMKETQVEKVEEPSSPKEKMKEEKLMQVESTGIITKDATKEKQKSGELVQKEGRGVGTTLTWKTLWAYFSAMGGWGAILYQLAFLVCVQVTTVLSTYWLNWWAVNQFGLALGFWIGGYALWSLANSLFSLGSTLLFAVKGVRAARVLHEKMVTTLTHCPITFFDATPVGRIMNRFTKDTAQIDGNLVGPLRMALSGLFQMASTLIVIGINTPYTLVMCVPIFTMFLFLQRYFRYTSRELKRLDSVTRSPIYAHFGETLSGLTTITAFGVEDKMVRHNQQQLDHNSRFIFALLVANRWLSMRLEFLGGLVIVVTAVFAILKRGELGAGVLALTLSYALTITSLLNMVIRLYTEAENAFTAVERVSEYCELEQEPTKYDIVPPADWPQEGKIQYEQATMRYRPDLPPTLKHLSFEINPSEKIGVVGRTGAGKSSLFLTLYRMVPICGGTIKIDGIDISKVSLVRLRKSLSIIPQDPVLYSGTIRHNLDPFHEYSDERLWEVLDWTHLKSLFTTHPKRLSADVTEGGSNYSVGQRQLLCLARALLRRSKILVIDEATANLDVTTDALIQKTIRERFSHCTTLTIAHRLNTVIDSDRILVLHFGEMKQLGAPKALLGIPPNKASIFRDLVNETGDQNAQYLKQLAAGGDATQIFDAVLKDVDLDREMAKTTTGALTTKQEKVLAAAHVLLEAIENIDSDEWKVEIERSGLGLDGWKAHLWEVVKKLIELAQEGNFEVPLELMQ